MTNFTSNGSTHEGCILELACINTFSLLDVKDLHHIIIHHIWSISYYHKIIDIYMPIYTHMYAHIPIYTNNLRPKCTTAFKQSMRRNKTSMSWWIWRSATGLAKKCFFSGSLWTYALRRESYVRLYHTHMK